MTAISQAQRRPRLGRDSIFIGLALAYFAAAQLAIDLTAGEWAVAFTAGFASFAASSLLCVGLIRFGVYVVVLQPERPIKQLFVEARSISRSRIIAAAPITLGMALLATVFAEVKIRVPSFGGFTWDQTFTNLDRAIHFGRLPWEWLQPLVGYWPATFLININYHLWLLVMWSVWLVFAYTDRPNRARFLLSFALLWTIGGGLFAVLFSSAGPAYYDALAISPNPYAPLMAYLNEANETVPILALFTHDFLWKGYIGEAPAFGISAMPSLHNAVALLLVLASRGFHPVIRAALVIHAVLIAIGSIHLAWHYAVDVYFAWALTLVFWYSLAPVARWWDRRHAI